jgi:hypothetical protein
MRKIRLDLDKLEVDSFDVAPDPDTPLGTVHGHVSADRPYCYETINEDNTCGICGNSQDPNFICNGDSLLADCKYPSREDCTIPQSLCVGPPKQITDQRCFVNPTQYLTCGVEPTCESAWTCNGDRWCAYP